MIRRVIFMAVILSFMMAGIAFSEEIGPGVGTIMISSTPNEAGGETVLFSDGSMISSAVRSVGPDVAIRNR